MFIEFTFADEINHFVQWLVSQYGEPLHEVSSALLRGVLLPIERLLREAPPAVVLAAIAALAWGSMRSVPRVAALTLVIYLIGCIGLWDALMQTLSIMIVASGLAIVIGIPLGVLMSRHDRMRQVLQPVLDVMQTLPTFVYLIPILMLFGLGKVPAIFATVLYAVAPLIRLTDLGIRQVDATVTEAAASFGTTPWQLLLTVQLPLARPSIMAGINQTTMMSLSMVVIASMIGARGLGEEVLIGIQTLDSGRGLQAGLAIVILAIVVDRITQGYGTGRRLREQKQGASAEQLPAPSGAHS